MMIVEEAVDLTRGGKDGKTFVSVVVQEKFVETKASMLSLIWATKVRSLR